MGVHETSSGFFSWGKYTNSFPKIASDECLLFSEPLSPSHPHRSELPSEANLSNEHAVVRWHSVEEAATTLDATGATQTTQATNSTNSTNATYSIHP